MRDYISHTYVITAKQTMKDTILFNICEIYLVNLIIGNEDQTPTQHTIRESTFAFISFY